MDKHAFGRWCEAQAAEFLRCSLGWRLLEQRVRFREGELDLIMVTPSGELRFVEVKGRRSDRFGRVVEAITSQKIRRMRRAVWRWREASGDRRPGTLIFVGVEGDRVPELTVMDVLSEQ